MKAVLRTSDNEVLDKGRLLKVQACCFYCNNENRNKTTPFHMYWGENGLESLFSTSGIGTVEFSPY